MKTNEDYIREGAGLAGWLECDEEGEYLQTPAQPFSVYIDEIGARCEQYLLDALAAQLERQYIEAVNVVRKVSYMTSMRKQPMNTNLTMWRIKFFVDSGVLK
jgi:hypothetical protein